MKYKKNKVKPIDLSSINSILDDNFEEDKQANKLNNLNEKILTKEINKVLKKNSLKPINTHVLLK
jgi:hypothetical protein